MVNIVERLYDIDALVPSAGRVARAIQSIRHHDAATATIDAPTGRADGSRAQLRRGFMGEVVVTLTPPLPHAYGESFDYLIESVVAMAGGDGMTLTSAVERTGGVFELTFKVSD